jgi:hypothetical protein
LFVSPCPESLLLSILRERMKAMHNKKRQGSWETQDQDSERTTTKNCSQEASKAKG